MAKKTKNPIEKSNPDDNPDPKEGSNSSVFKSLFGEIAQQDSSVASLFSDNNPFRRKNEPVITIQPTEPENEEAAELKKRKKSKKAELPESEEKGGGDDSNLGENGETEKKKKKKKRKRDDVETEYEASRYGVKKKEGEVEKKSVVLGEKRKKIDDSEHLMVAKEGFDDESKLLRTVFVGNLPLKAKKKELLKEFSNFGEVESVRIRSVPLADGKIPRKGAVIKKHFNENGDSVHAYIVFKTEESAQDSLSHNMAVVGGNHIRVDRACPPRKKLKGDKSDNSTLYDNKRTVFVGNLPFDVKTEEIYQLFCGIKNLETSVEAVRVIRDPESSVGKGIAYVLFKTEEAARLVVRRRNLKLRDRELRLSPAKSDTTPTKRKYPSSPGANNHSGKRLAVEPRTPGSENEVKSKSNLSYQGLRASKSGSQKKVQTRISTPAKSQSKSQTGTKKSASNKRPAVAARKEKALQAAKASTKVVGTKRKFGNRTPESGGQKKKARKFR